MILHQNILAILDNHKLNTNSSNIQNEQWLMILQDLNKLILQNEENYAQLQKILDLGYEEMNKMWSLIKRRDLLTQSIFDSSSDMIFVLDSQGQIIEHNISAVDILAPDKNIILGQPITSIIAEGSLNHLLKQCFKTSDLTSILHFCNIVDERTIKINSDKELVVLYHLKQVTSHDITMYVLYLKDLTIEKLSTQAIENSRAQLMMNAKMSALGEMAGGIAHEINTPLAVIQIRTNQLQECLKESPLNIKLMDSSLKSIEQTVKKISTIINGLRSFARDGHKDPFTTNSISKIIEDTFILCKERFKHHSVQLNFEATQDVEISCRPGEISQVLLNFLNNAFDAIEHLNEKWITVALSATKTDAVISITDSGSGIPLDIQKKLAEPFFTTKEVGKGTGLGLSISKGIIDSHQGSITIDNSSKNTKFDIKIPLLQNNIDKS